MTIRVARDGYARTCLTSGGVIWIDGVLHQHVTPVNGPDLWVPVRSYDGEVEYVDARGRPIVTAESRRHAGAPAGREGGRDAG